jgi:hypothetical protein
LNEDIAVLQVARSRETGNPRHIDDQMGGVLKMRYVVTILVPTGNMEITLPAVSVK